ncbi:MAG TPA: hypothetical protein VHF69_00510, partial [Candidatus Synoicihabitans sp.]|nr:hypothetical protein [Candidatus Synoicihabitans sp.]
MLRPELVPNPPFLAARFTRRVIRPRDLLVLDFTFVNLRVEVRSDGARHLVRAQVDRPSYLVVGFPAQHVLERAFFEEAEEAPVQDPPPAKPGQPPYPPDPDKTSSSETPQNSDVPVATRLAGPSRLVFRVPATFSSLPYTLEAVLEACRNYELSVAPTATPPDPRITLRPGLVLAVTDRPSLSPSITQITARTTAPRATGRTVAARAAAAQAMTATVFAEARNQWYAKRSPLARESIAQTEIADVAKAIDALRILPKLAAPGDTETAIEAPTRLILSPNSYGAWVHALAPVESAQTGHVELWHTRLGVGALAGVTEEDDFRRAVRAIWSPDVRADQPFSYTVHPPPTPFRASLDAFDRHNIVHLSANHQLYIPNTSPRKRHRPQPVEVNRLMLTSLGVWMDVRGAWDPPAPLSVEEWRHRATLGRDHYVRVVYAGALYPFGHRASLIKVTERKFHPNNKGNAAFLRQRMFIVVREPYRVLGNTGLFDQGDSLDRKMPMKAARLTTLVTPNLDNPEKKYCAVVPAPGAQNPERQSIFWPHVSEKPFLFHLQFEDETGAKIDAAMPLFFVGDEKLKPGVELIPKALGAGDNRLAHRYSTFAGFRPMRRVPLHGQRVQLAPTSKPGDTSFELAEFEFGLSYVATDAKGQAAESGVLVPGMISAAAEVPT